MSLELLMITDINKNNVCKKISSAGFGAYSGGKIVGTKRVKCLEILSQLFHLTLPQQ